MAIGFNSIRAPDSWRRCRKRNYAMPIKRLFDAVERRGDIGRRVAALGRIMQAAAVPVGMSWMWTLAFGYHEDRTPSHGYAASRYYFVLRVRLLKVLQVP